jgi:hypothetical protein
MKNNYNSILEMKDLIFFYYKLIISYMDTIANYKYYFVNIITNYFLKFLINKLMFQYFYAGPCTDTYF